ncbi:class I SAM-dependent DNA methyltransferase [Truepera radiovictrix]|uniref:Methyltransferase type 11 n=1 Tax=Truepera radiovictrix (strain DSM 17093 / CIP 108686 / LMG 22925 / RQ-24) TaxID=649638 RepID=D7CVV7_TRURR|nr:class I SAM-dependent methyltransferase [Truepera radiovictrix]ADI16018.1 Methyltransferase type 11 [Truepera radiovictrix DSM 17093]WMT58356.1 methyltransferase domain-containing protein [Truepera radiovictrix]
MPPQNVPPPFSRLADVYDAIMSDIAYDAWAAFILQLAQRAGAELPAPARTRLLDLGCGTGNSAAPFVARGMQVVGLDAAERMLEVARRKLPEARFVRATFTDFSLPGRFDLVVSVFDALNNLLEPGDLRRCGERVLAHLEPHGAFVFDVNTTHGLRELWEGGRAEGWVDDVYYLWEHTFDETTGLAQVVAYCERGGRSFTEVHVERPYDPPEIEALLRAAGFSSVRAVTYPDADAPTPETERVWVVARP